MSLQPHWQQPSHPHLLELISPSPPSSPTTSSSAASSESSFLSFSRSKVSLAPGEHLVTLTSPPLTLAQRAYSSVQVSASSSVELNCDFLYLNHSCAPSLELRVTDLRQPNAAATSATKECPFEISIHATRNISPGDELTFFYPSTEWDMAQPFACRCGTGQGKCLGTVRGAKYLEWREEEVKERRSERGWFVNGFIWEMVEKEREGK